MSKTALAVASKNGDRSAIFEKMTKPLQAIAAAMDKEDTKEIVGIVLCRYTMGTHIKQALGDATKYGENAVELLSAYLEISPSYLYHLRDIATVFTLAEVKALLARTMANGRKISVNHLRVLQQIVKPEERKKAIGLIFSHSLTADELAAEVAKHMERTRHHRGGGSKPARPATPLAAAQQIEKTCEQQHNRFDGWKVALFDEVDQMDATRADTALLDKMKKAQAKMDTLQNDIDGAMPRLEANINRVEGIIKKNVSDQKAADNATKGKARRRE